MEAGRRLAGVYAADRQHILWRLLGHDVPHWATVRLARQKCGHCGGRWVARVAPHAPTRILRRVSPHCSEFHHWSASNAPDASIEDPPPARLARFPRSCADRIAVERRGVRGDIIMGIDGGYLYPGVVRSQHAWPLRDGSVGSQCGWATISKCQARRECQGVGTIWTFRPGRGLRAIGSETSCAFY